MKPLPKGTISMHVRHGDKASEMQLLSLDHYVKAAESLANTNPMLYYKIGFVSTEDQAVIDETRNITALDGNTTTPNLDWIWFSSNIPRMNGSGADQLATFGRSMMTIRWMLQLFMVGQLRVILNFADLHCRRSNAMPLSARAIRIGTLWCVSAFLAILCVR